MATLVRSRYKFPTPSKNSNRTIVTHSVSSTLEIFLNIANLNEAIDVTRKRGFNRSDLTLNNELYYNLISKIDNNINDLLLSTPTNSRAKVYEEHYGASIDIGFRYNFK